MLVCVVGNYGDKKKLTDGQSIKTAELYDSLLCTYGPNNVGKVNLYSKNKLTLSFKLLYALIKSDNLIVLVSVNGRKTVIPLLVALNKIFHKKIYHSLIGSTTHKTLDENKKYVKIYNALAGNWAETTTEQQLLAQRGLRNVSVVRNFKNLDVLTPDKMEYIVSEPFPLCTFSRVEELKGIPNIVHAVKKVNKICGRTVYTLDIYGKVMNHYEEDFDKLKMEFGTAIRYRGVVDYNKSVETLKHYYLLVFPTRYYTEGIPGTLLDAFSAGVPVLSAEWESCHDIMNENVGIIYSFDNDDALVDALLYAANNPSAVNRLKEACLLEAKKYTPNEVINEIAKYLEG